MQGTRFDVDQVAELHRIERARMRRGQPGLRGEVGALIARLTSGGVGTPDPAKGRKAKGPKLPDRDPRILKQAKVLWDKGWGQRLGKPSFDHYLLDIPDVPAFFAGYDGRFPHLVLVDQRIQIVEACEMLRVHTIHDSRTFAPREVMQSDRRLVYWMRCQDGKAYRKRQYGDCRREFASHGDEFGLEVHEGLALYAQFPNLLEEVGTAWDLPGSIGDGNRGNCACIKRYSNGVTLYLYVGGGGDLRRGSASRGRYVG